MINKQNIELVQYEIVANKRTGIVMYADAGDRNRAYQVTGQDNPTTPQRHTFRKAGITTIYTEHFFASTGKKRNFCHGIMSFLTIYDSTPAQGIKPGPTTW